MQTLAEVLEQRAQNRTAALEEANRELEQQIAERQRTESALRSSQDQLRVALDAARMGVWEWELPSNEVRWSERAAALFGMALHQFDGSADTVMRMVHPDDRQRVRAVVDDCIEGRTQDFFAEYRVVRQDGKVRWLEARGRLYRSETGEPLRMAGLTTDVTDQKLAELALAAERGALSIGHLRAGRRRDADRARRAVPDRERERRAHPRVDPGRVDGPQAARPGVAHGVRRRHAVPGFRLPGCAHARDRAALPRGADGRAARRSDGLRWITINTKPLFRAGEARPHAVVASFADVTDRMAAEAAQRESEERYRTLVEHAPEAIVVLDPDSGHFVDVNENAIRLFGLPRAALLALGPLELSAPVQLDGRSSAEAAPAYIAAAVRGETPVFEWVHRDADGWDITCEVRLVRLRSGERWLVRGSILDIGERKRIEAALRESEAKFAAVFRVCPESISISSVDDGVYVDVNDAYEQVFGYRRERVLGRSALDLGVWVDALERRDLVRRLEQDRIVQDFDASIRRADGEIRIARMSGGMLELNGKRCVIMVVRDVTRQKEQEEALRLAARVFESTAEGILITDPRSRIVAVNQAFTELTGYTEARGARPPALAAGFRAPRPPLLRRDVGRHQPQRALARRGLEPHPGRRGAPLPHHHQHPARRTRHGAQLRRRAARHLHHQAVAAAARVPGQLRRPHRPGQPQLVLHAPEGGDREGLAPPPPARGGVRRPGQLQGHQRHPRPRRGRRAARPRSPSASRPACGRRTWCAGWAATSSPSTSRTSSTRRRWWAPRSA